MTDPARVMVLGFDAMDRTTVRSLAESGKLPTFRRLLSSAVQARIDNPCGFFVSNAWTSFAIQSSGVRMDP